MGKQIVSILCEEHIMPMKEMVKWAQAFISKAQVTKYFKGTQSDSA